MCSVYYGESLHYTCIPFIMVRASSSVVAVVSLDSLDTLIGRPWTAGHHPLLTSLSAFLSSFQMTRQLDDWMTSHVTLFFGIQFVIRCSINRDTYRHLYIQCSDSHFFISALALSPLLGANLCHIM